MEKFNFKYEKEIEEYVNQLLSSKTKSNIDPYFDEMAAQLLKVIIMYVQENEIQENWNLNRCIEIIKENIGKSKEESAFNNKIQGLGFGNHIAMEYMSLKILPDKTYREIFDTLNEKLSQ